MHIHAYGVIVFLTEMRVNVFLDMWLLIDSAAPCNNDLQTECAVCIWH